MGQMQRRLLLLLLLANGQRVNQIQHVCVCVCAQWVPLCGGSSLVTDHPIGRQADALVIKTLNEHRVASSINSSATATATCYVLPATCYLLPATCNLLQAGDPVNSLSGWPCVFDTWLPKRNCSDSKLVEAAYEKYSFIYSKQVCSRVKRAIFPRRSRTSATALQ